MKMTGKIKMTTAASAPVADIQNTMTAAGRGPALLQDVWLLEKLANFDREVIPERRMHAKGSGAIGAFTVTHDITPLHQGQALLRSRQADGDVS
jgi:catalase